MFGTPTRAGAVALLLATPACFAQAETMNFSHFVPTGHQVHKVAEMWGQSIAEASGGDLDLRIFPAEQLGKAVDHYDMIASGTVDAGWVVAGYTPGRFPVIEAGELPFLVSDAALGAKALHEWYEQYVEDEMSEIRFCAIVTHEPGRIHTKEPIASAADMKGVKLRPATAVVGNYLAALGAVPVKLASPEARQGVERGVVDGVTFPWSTIINFGLTDALTHHVDIPLYIPMAFFGINTGFYEGLSDANKAVIDEHCSPEWTAKLTGNWAAWEQEGRPAIEAMVGHEFVVPEGDDLQPWIDAAQGVNESWRDQITERMEGADPDAMLDDLKLRISAAGAGL